MRPKNTLVCVFLYFWLGLEQCCGIQPKTQTLETHTGRYPTHAKYPYTLLNLNIRGLFEYRLLLKTENIVVKSFLNMWIVPWDPVLKKKLCKLMTCRFHEQCMGPTKKCQMHRQKNFNNIQTLTRYCIFFFFLWSKELKFSSPYYFHLLWVKNSV